MFVVRAGIAFLLGLVLLVLALANRDPTVLRLVPESFPFVPALQGSIVVPVFVVMFGGAAVGILIGFTWEWFREFGRRVDKSRSQRKLKKNQEPD